MPTQTDRGAVPPHRGLLGRPPELPWKRLAGAALVAAAGATGAVWILSTIDLARGSLDTWLRLGAGLLSLAGGLLGLMEFHRRRTEDIARGRVVAPADGLKAPPPAFRTAACLAISLLAVATVLAMGVDVVVQMSSAGSTKRRDGAEALRDARTRNDSNEAGTGNANGSASGGSPGLVGPDTSGRDRGAIDKQALGNLLSDEVVFEVLDETAAGIGQPSPFWGESRRPLLLRGFVIDSFDAGGTLRERSGDTLSLGGPTRAQIDHPYSSEEPRTESPKGHVLDLRFRFFGGHRGLIFSPHELVRLDAGRAKLDTGTLALTASLAGKRTYTVQARIPWIGPDRLAAADARGSRPAGDKSLALPPVQTKDRRRANAALDRLARDVTRNAPNDMERVLAVVQHLRSSFAYELYHVDFLNPEGCAQLMERGAGSCTHFASMATLLLRRVGIPTRIAAGYVAREGLGDARDDRGWVVRQRDGHAWIEVHFEGLGWLPFDPTPGDATVGGALAGWSPLDSEWELDGGRTEISGSTTALSALARAGVEALRQQGISALWLLLGTAGAIALWGLARRQAAPAPGAPQATAQGPPPIRVGGGAEDPAILALFQALRARGFIQPKGMTPRAFARSVENDLPGALGLEESVLAMLRAAAGRGAIEAQERAAMADLARRIADSEPSGA